MNIKEIKLVVDSDLPDSIKEAWIIRKLAQDKNVIPCILSILEEERKEKDTLVTELNLQLSRAHIYIDMAKIDTKKEIKSSFNKRFVIGEIEKFYKKYKGIIRHCFNKFN